MPRNKISALKSPYYSNLIGSVAFTVPANDGGTNTLVASLQLKGTAGQNLAQRGMIHFFITDDASGDTLTATAPTTVAAGTNGWVHNGATTKYSHALSEANGTIDISIAYAVGAKTWYIGVILPDGSISMSPAVIFS